MGKVKAMLMEAEEDVPHLTLKEWLEKYPMLDENSYFEIKLKIAEGYIGG